MFGKGTVSINAENIMPVIKQWLYSDKDIFVRELVSNGCDAISKLKRLAASGEASVDADAFRVDVIADPEKGTLQFIDNGLGMTGDEVIKYIAQVAFSGATDFVQKYASQEKNGEQSGIIGHFGLGFYSCFMVSDKVEIDTKSYIEGEPAVRWVSEDGMEYELTESDRSERGTCITLHISEEDHDFLKLWTLRGILEKYCEFMPVPIYVSEIKKAEAKEGEDAPASEFEQSAPQQINETHPLWLKRPNECTNEEYLEFYHSVFHDMDDPLFWIHLNAEYPFNLKGILYFPKLKNEFSANEGVIKLYNNQVFVADNIKEVIPEFLMLLKGVIDCPDLPLNVSRSFLQNDGYVRKMSDYITRKVADRLMSEFNTKREDYQKYWKDIHPFVKYGCIRDEKFFSRVKEAIIYRTTAGEFLTAQEYKQRNCEGDETLMYYTSDEKRQAQMIEMFTSQGKDVVVMDTLIDNHFMSFLEYAAKEDQVKFRRVDAGLDGLTEEGETDVEAEKKLHDLFREATGEKELDVKLATLKSDEMPAMITVEEQSRRFTEMSREWGGGMQMPEKRTLTLNRKHPLIAYLEREDGDADMRKTVCEQVVDLAEMARQPLTAERMVAFLKRSTKILGLAVKE